MLAKGIIYGGQGYILYCYYYCTRCALGRPYDNSLYSESKFVYQGGSRYIYSVCATGFCSNIVISGLGSPAISVLICIYVYVSMCV